MFTNVIFEAIYIEHFSLKSYIFILLKVYFYYESRTFNFIKTALAIQVNIVWKTAIQNE